MAAQTASQALADQAWAEVADLLDLQLSPLGLAAMDRLAPLAGQTILDVGCGAGQTVRQLADRVGPKGRVIGVDIAPRVLEVARARTRGLGQVQLMQADAATLALPDGMLDGAYSRFGVMALAEPAAAFANFHRMTKRGGRLAFVCWRSLADNELDRVPLEAAGLGTAIERAIDTTPFKFERRETLVELLRTAGFADVQVEALDTRVSSGDVEAMLTVLTRVGPLGKILRERPDLLAAATPGVRAALASAATGDRQVSLRAATWIATATA